MRYNVTLEQRNSRPLAVVRRQARSQELAKLVPEGCGIVWNVVGAQQVKGVGRNIAIYLDDAINLEVGVELESGLTGFGEVVGSVTPAGLVATTTHYGPYSGLQSAHKAIQLWCKENGQQLAGPNWEIYGHWQDEWNSDPSTISTEIYYLLVAGGSLVAERKSEIHEDCRLANQD